MALVPNHHEMSCEASEELHINQTGEVTNVTAEMYQLPKLLILIRKNILDYSKFEIFRAVTFWITDMILRKNGTRTPKKLASPEIANIFDVFLRFLGSESVMLNALQEYIVQRDQVRAPKMEDKELVEESASQEMVFNVEEAEWAPLPESDDDEAGNWLAEAESRAIRVPVLATQQTLVAAEPEPEEFHSVDVAKLPEQVPQTEPYTIVRREEKSMSILCAESTTGNYIQCKVAYPRVNAS
uniref:BACK domain-containing protein n=1 Tax=Setaria digitata TaxID=48799 RepID=A0A915PRE7_9BILA